MDGSGYSHYITEAYFVGMSDLVRMVHLHRICVTKYNIEAPTTDGTEEIGNDEPAGRPNH